MDAPRRMRTVRETLGLDQAGLAALLNDRLGRRYDAPRVNRWEKGNEAIPATVSTAIDALAAELRDRERRCVVVAIANQKGGVGKTVSTVNIAYALSEAGAKVLVIDADAQGNLTNTFGGTENAVRAETDGRTLYHVLAGKAPLRDTLMPTQYPGITLAPATLSLARADAEVTADPIKGIYRLDDQVRDARADYDAILIDCGPSLTGVTVSALVAADLVVIPVQTEHYATLGVSLILGTIADVQARPNPRLEVLGVLPTLHDKRTVLARAMLDDLKGTFGARHRIFDPIPRAATYGTATAVGQAALAVEPDVKGAEVYRAIATSILARSLAPRAKEAAHG